MTAQDETEVQVSSQGEPVHYAWIHNPNSEVVYLQVWDDLAANVTPGSDAPRYTFPIDGAFIGMVPLNVVTNTALTIAITGAVDGSGTITTDCVGNLSYR